jgi:signal transduction histidine kinase
VEAAVKRLVERAKEYLLFSNYALRIMAALASQQECLSPGFSRLNLQEIFEVIALSGVFRSLIYRERNIDFRIGEYAPEKAADPGYVGVLMHLEPGLQLRTIEPYVTSVFYNLVKNAFKIMLWNPQGEPVPGAKVVVSAVTHPKYPSVAVVEIIDNGPGFDLKTIAQQALFVSDSTPVAAGLPAELRDSLRRMNGSPYAYALSVNELMRMVFLYRLTTAGGGGFGSGLGLYGANQFLTQLHGSCVVGMNHAKTEPFHTGARFMFFIPKDPYAFMPDLNLLTRDMEYGALDTPVFCG